MGILDAAVLGVVQGLTEFLPISSSGHLILAREFLPLDVVGGLAFDAVLHFATALAVVAYFWKDILRLLHSFLLWTTRVYVDETDRRMLIALIVATIPAVFFGVLLESYMETVFRSALLVMGALVVGSLIMLMAEKISAPHLSSPRSNLGKDSNEYEKEDDQASLSAKRALVVGLFQSLALIPGMSRSGMAISGGMLMGLSREMAARFAFLLAIPVLLGAGGKKILELGQSGALISDAAALTAGALSAFIVGIAVVHFLLKFLRSHSLMVFVWYRLALAVLVLVFVLM